MHEDIIPGSKHNVDGVNVSKDQTDHDLSCHSKVHIKVVHSLSKDGLPSGLANYVVKELPNHIAVEVA